MNPVKPAAPADNCKTSGRRKSRRRRWLMAIILILVVWGVIEGIMVGALSLTDREFSFRKLRERQTQIAEGSAVSEGAGETIHPYLGWVHNPQVGLPEKYEGHEIPINSLGFRDSSESVQTRSSDTFIIGVAGGSVAWQFSWAAEKRLRELLGQHPKIRGRRIEIVRMALSGYKQPQQLLALSYLLSLGAEFDLIINIDGFNETNLAILENAIQNTFVSYPRSWHARALTMTDPRNSADAARLLYLRGKRQQMARSILNSSLRKSPAVNFIWHIRDHWANSELIELGLQVSANRRSSFVHHGPANSATGESLDEDVARLWMNSSLQMHRLAQGNGALYLHVLQPNQYVVDSKPMGEEERKRSFLEDGETREVIRRLFPRLQKHAETLIRQGVSFSDQTMVFSETPEPLYIDPWCHFNLKGNEILCDAICRRVMELLDE